MHFPSEGEGFAGKIEKDGAVERRQFAVLFVVVVRKLSERTLGKSVLGQGNSQSQAQ